MRRKRFLNSDPAERKTRKAFKRKRKLALAKRFARLTLLIAVRQSSAAFPSPDQHVRLAISEHGYSSFRTIPKGLPITFATESLPAYILCYNYSKRLPFN